MIREVLDRLERVATVHCLWGLRVRPRLCGSNKHQPVTLFSHSARKYEHGWWDATSTLWVGRATRQAGFTLLSQSFTLNWIWRHCQVQSQCGGEKRNLLERNPPNLVLAMLGGWVGGLVGGGSPKTWWYFCHVYRKARGTLKANIFLLSTAVMWLNFIFVTGRAEESFCIKISNSLSKNNHQIWAILHASVPYGI